MKLSAITSKHALTRRTFPDLEGNCPVLHTPLQHPTVIFKSAMFKETPQKEIRRPCVSNINTNISISKEICPCFMLSRTV